MSGDDVEFSDVPASQESHREKEARASTGRSSLNPDDLKFMWEEYKLLQDKVDRIGTFQFQVKGWLVTLMTGLIVTRYVAETPAWVLLLGLALIMGFGGLEWNQHVLRQAYLARATAIELFFRQNSLSGAFRRPDYEKRRAFKDSIPPASPAEAVGRARAKLNWIGRILFRFIGPAFYALQVIVIVGAMFLTPGAQIWMKSWWLPQANRSESSSKTDGAAPDTGSTLAPPAIGDPGDAGPPSVRTGGKR